MDRVKNEIWVFLSRRKGYFKWGSQIISNYNHQNGTTVRKLDEKSRHFMSRARSAFPIKIMCSGLYLTNGTEMNTRNLFSNLMYNNMIISIVVVSETIDSELDLCVVCI